MEPKDTRQQMRARERLSAKGQSQIQVDINSLPLFICAAKIELQGNEKLDAVREGQPTTFTCKHDTFLQSFQLRPISKLIAGQEGVAAQPIFWRCTACGAAYTQEQITNSEIIQKEGVIKQ